MSPAIHERHRSVEEAMKKDQLRHPKKLIVCCDGTWQDSDNGWEPGKWGQPGKLQNPSNVTRIARAMKSQDQSLHPQIVYYQAGVGTGIGLYDHLVGGGTGMGLSENIREAYAFLAANYQPADVDDGHETCAADKIFLIGFSRGAFTARSLGGFIGAVGILTKKAIPWFYQCFQDWEKALDPQASQFFSEYQRMNSHEMSQDDLHAIQEKLAAASKTRSVDEYMRTYREILIAYHLTNESTINAIGVWDTVGALGIPINPILQKIFGLPAFIKQYSWFDTRLDTRVKNAFQALALDEYRFPYSPAVWSGNGKTNLKQVWFPGAHSNVGGAYSDYGMANITLAWMMDHLSGKSSSPFIQPEPENWIEFDNDYIDNCFRQTNEFYNKHKPWSEQYRGWAMGMVYDSCKFPQSLAGTRTRSPGMYHETDYATGKYKKDKLLEDTNEYIHASVRARVDMGGPSVEPEEFYRKIFSRIWRFITFQSSDHIYRPARHPGWLKWLTAHGPLYEWRLMDGHDRHHEPNMDIDMSPGGIKEVHWKYVGTQPCCTPEMKEDIIAEGGYEEKLLLHDQKLAKDLLISNDQWQWRRKRPLRHHLFSHTF